MHVAVLGAGVAGVTTAYYLAEQGHSVTVIDARPGVAGGASSRNGAQLSYSFTDAFASPALLRKLPGQMMGLDPAIKVKPAINPTLIRWGWALVRQCTSGNANKNTISVLKMAQQSSVLMQELMHKVPMDFSFRKAGKLVLLKSGKEVESARTSCELKRENGCETDVLNFDEAASIEPAIAGFANRYAAAIWSQDDEVGCPVKFCRGLSEWLIEHQNVEFRFNETIKGIKTKNGKMTGIKTSSQLLEPDAVVVCLGAGSTALMANIGRKVKIYPVRGYSLTLPLGPAPAKVSITDLSSKIVFSRLGDKVRIAGLADIVGFDDSNDAARISDLADFARSVAPSIADYSARPDHGWGGYRPMTPDSQPLVGQSGVEGVFLNTGHGMLGWTLACATGHRLARSVGASC